MKKSKSKIPMLSILKKETKMKKRAQSAMEFSLLIGVILFIFLSFLFVFQQDVARKSIEKRNMAFEELALTVQNELNIAAKATDGYRREFIIPNKVLGVDYSITLISNSIYLNSTNGKHAMSFPGQNVTGILTKGTNVITKINSTIYLNI